MEKKFSKKGKEETSEEETSEEETSEEETSEEETSEEETTEEETSEEETSEEETSEDEILDDDTHWLFFFDRTPFRFRVLPALLLSIIIPVLSGFILSILSINENPLLFQLSAILMVCTLCIYSLLRRSKLSVLVNFPIACFIYLIVFVANLLTDGWYYFPFGIFGNITKGPLRTILSNLINLGWIDETINISSIILIPPILDLIIIGFISLVIGFIATVLITGIKNAEGEINLLIIPVKIFSAVFLIILVITVPLTYVGVSKFTEGSAYFGASITEFAFLQRYLENEGGSGTQNYDPFDLLNSEFKQLFLEAVDQAYIDLMKSYSSFTHVKENLLLKFLLNYFAPEQIQTDDYTAINTQNITRLLDLTLVLADIMQAAPGIIHGFVNSYYGLRTGATIIVQAFDSQNSAYNESFPYSVDQISLGVNNFTEAARAPLLDAIDNSMTILDDVFVALQTEKDNTVEMNLRAFRFGVPAVIHLFKTCPQLINATYKVILGINNIIDLRLTTALDWMVSAALDVITAIDILLDLEDSQLVSIEEEPLPFRATLEFVRDLRDTIAYLTTAGVNLINFYITVGNSLSLLDQIELNATTSSIDPRWSYIDHNITKAETLLNDFASNTSAAYENTTLLKEKFYGPLTDTVHPFWVDLHTLTSDFKDNIVELDHFYGVLTNTINATFHFTQGSENILSSLDTATDNNTFANLKSTNYATENLSLAMSEANQAYMLMSDLTFINRDMKNNWLDILKDNDLNQSFFGLAASLTLAIDKVKSDDYSLAEGLSLVTLMRNRMDEITTLLNFLKFY